MAKDKKDPDVLVQYKDTQAMIDALNNQYKTNIATPGEDELPGEVYKYSTGILSLDKYLGVGGLRGGRITNLWGHEGTGKTLTALTIGAAIQRQNMGPCIGNPEGFGRVAFLDAEGTLSKPMATAVGLDFSRTTVIQSTPEKILSGEDYFAIMKILIQNNFELIIVDSVPALQPRSVMGRDVGEGQMSPGALMMSQGLGQITAMLNAFKRTHIIMINQTRMKPGVKFGSPEYHTGGEALKFYETYSLKMKKAGEGDEWGDVIRNVPNPLTGRNEDRIIGVNIEATLYKNKTASIPVEPIHFSIYFTDITDKDGVKYTTGVDTYSDVFNVALQHGVVKQNSSWYTYGDIKGNGQSQFVAAMRAAGPELLTKIRHDLFGDRA